MTIVDGTITSIVPKALPDVADHAHILNDRQFLIPGFVDAHVHAPQYPNVGLGADLPLLDWLRKYIFSLEARFKDLVFARKVYSRVVDRMLACGTTTASYFGTIHTDACLLLADIIHDKGQRAFVGKVNMTVNTDENYGESVDESLAETERFIQMIKEKQYLNVEPIITPRFAVTCDMDTLTRLGNLASQHNLRIQTHLSENQAEIDTVKEMNPGCDNYTEVYRRAGLLTKQTILAHSIHLSEQEIEVLAETGSSVIHCPGSNCFLQSGVCDSVKLTEYGVNIGLGTDMGAGYSPSILESARRSLEVSSVLTNTRRDGANHEISTGESKVSTSESKVSTGESKVSTGERKVSTGERKVFTGESKVSTGESKVSNGKSKTLGTSQSKVSTDQSNEKTKSSRKKVQRDPLKFDQAFYFATLGGAKALNLEDKIGNFRRGKQFDALLINLDARDSPVDFTSGLSLQEKFAKFFFTGDDRNVEKVFVDGRMVVDKSGM